MTTCISSQTKKQQLIPNKHAYRTQIALYNNYCDPIPIINSNCMYNLYNKNQFSEK